MCFHQGKDYIFTVTCIASGGTVVSSSLTGPGVVDLELQPVESIGRTGQNTYSVTIAAHYLEGAMEILTSAQQQLQYLHLTPVTVQCSKVNCMYV